MTETFTYGKNILNRAHRVHGQIEALEKAIEEHHERTAVMQLLAATRGAINGLMAEIMENMLNEQVINHCEISDAQQESLDEVLRLVRTYLK